jgi:S1-C subfamily serine protease
MKSVTRIVAAIAGMVAITTLAVGQLVLPDGWKKSIHNNSYQIVMKDEKNVWQGSGFAVEKDLIMTACHVVDKNRTVQMVRHYYEHHRVFKGEVVYCNEATDVALIRLNKKDEEVEPAVFEQGHLFDTTYNMGLGGDWGPVVRSGFVGVYHPGFGLDQRMNPGFPADYGDSGSAIYNEAGRVIAMLTAVRMYGIPIGRWGWEDIPSALLSAAVGHKMLRLAVDHINLPPRGNPHQ